MDNMNGNGKKGVLVPTNVVVRSLALSPSNSSQGSICNLAAKARDVAEIHIKAIRDFTRAQLVFLEGKRKHIAANDELSMRYNLKSKELMELYQKDKAEISAAFAGKDITKELLEKHLMEAKRIQDKTTRLQAKAKLLVEKRKSAVSSVRTPSSFGSSQKWYESLNNSEKLRYLRERRKLAEHLNKNCKDSGDKSKKSPQKKDPTTMCTLQEKAVGTVNQGIRLRMEKISHIPLDERRRLIASSFYENEYSWLEIKETDAFIMSKIIA